MRQSLFAGSNWEAAETNEQPSWFKRNCANLCASGKNLQRTRRRLGKKISYLSLYEYCHIVDKHEN